MRERSRIILLIVIMAVAAGTTAGISIALLYNASIEEQKDRLVESAKSQARLIEAIARYNSSNGKDLPEHALQATLEQVRDARRNYKGLGKTGEFTLSRKEGDLIVFLLRQRHSDSEIPQPIPWKSDLAEPMRLALSNMSGTIIGLDYRGEKVLAAYEPLQELSMGIVAKIDMEEIRQPFIEAGLVSGIIALLTVIAGSILFLRVSDPMLRELKAHRDHLEEMVAKRTEELEKTNHELEDLAYIVSHDLREPLRGINNFATFLQEDYSEKIDEEGRSMLQTLVDLAKRQEEQIISILNYSRVGRKELELHEVDLNEIVNEVRDTLKISIAEKHFEVRIPAPLPSIVMDRSHLQTIFNNLITNAIKYNDNTNGWVEIGIYPSQKGRNTVYYVRDNGIGIPERHVDKVFTIFKRLHHKDKYGGGTGAGLAIVKKIIERHKGRIWLESTVGEGTTFYFEFPS